MTATPVDGIGTPKHYRPLNWRMGITKNVCTVHQDSIASSFKLSESCCMKRFAILICLIVLGNARLLTAQDFAPFANKLAGIKSVISKFTENTPQFTAVFHFQVLDTTSVPRLQMMMAMTMAEKDMRADVFVTALPQIPPEQRALMKSLQMDRIVLLTRINEKKSYIVFPEIQAYQEFPINDDTLKETARRSTAVRLQKTEVGQETVNGHACTKTLVEITETNRTSENAIIWIAPELKEFPVRIAVRKGNLLDVFEFKNVQLTSPSPTVFEIPTNYTRLKDTADVLRIAKERFQARGGSVATPIQREKSGE